MSLSFVIGYTFFFFLSFFSFVRQKASWTSTNELTRTKKTRPLQGEAVILHSCYTIGLWCAWFWQAIKKSNSWPHCLVCAQSFCNQRYKKLIHGSLRKLLYWLASNPYMPMDFDQFQSLLWRYTIFYMKGKAYLDKVVHKWFIQKSIWFLV